MKAVLVLALLLASAAAGAQEPSADTRERFHTLYPNVAATGFERTPVDGLVAVRTDDTRFYFAPAPGLLLFGEFFDPAGHSLGGEPHEHAVQDAPLAIDPSTVPPEVSGGVHVKDGSVAVTAYLDVHCGYCAQAVDWIVNDNGLPKAGLNVVFVSRSEQDLALAEHVLCAPMHLRTAALLQVFARGPGPERLSCAKGRAEAQAQGGMAARNGVSATPVFAVSGQTVLGFNRERLESLVDQAGHQAQE